MGNSVPCRKHYVADADSFLIIRFQDGHVEHRIGPASVTLSWSKHRSIEERKLTRYVADQDQFVRVQFRDGRVEHIVGPVEVVMNELEHHAIEVKQLQRYVADQNEYLLVQFRDGSKEHYRGPCELILDSFRHASITVEKAWRLGANEALVVYSKQDASPESGTQWVAKQGVLSRNRDESAARDDEGPLLTLAAEVSGSESAAHVQRRVVYGPTIFMPKSCEWVHTFSWHGSIKDGKGSKTGYSGDVKVPHALEFSVLRCMPDQMYYTVREVRTSDDAHLTVNLMIFYELKNIEKMLDSTNDMIGDFINAASADIMTFAANHTYESFLQKTAELSDLSTFPILQQRMEQTGTELQKVVYRGLAATAQLQEMHNDAIVKRTKLRLQTDTAKEEQEKMDLELRCRQERSERERQIEEASTRHAMELLALRKEQERKEMDADHAQKLRHAKELAELETAKLKSMHDEEIRRNEAFKSLDVDLTKFLCALAESKPDQHLRIDANAPALHVEMPNKPPVRR